MKLTFDHIHCVHTDVDEAVAFYVNVFGATETNRIDRGGAPQVYLDVQGASIIIRGKRDGEELAAGPGGWPRYSIDHYAYCVEGKLADAVAEVRANGGNVIAEGEADELWFAYVEGPDGVVVEMMEMK